MLKKQAALAILVLSLLLIVYGTIAQETDASSIITKRFYTTAGDGRVTIAGFSWDRVHDSPIGFAIADEQETFVGTAEYEGHFGISRVFLPVDTSGLPDDIVSAEMYIAVPLMQTYDEDEQGYLVIVGDTTQESTDTLTSTDFDECTSVDNPTEASNRLFFREKSEGWWEFDLNEDGKDMINKNGVTMLGLREGHDVEDVPIDTFS